MIRGTVFAFSVLLAFGCASEPDAPISANEAIQRANADFADALPQVPLELMTVEVRDGGSHWQVIYRPPQGSTGPEFLGPVVIDKRTGVVVQGMKGTNYIEADRPSI